MYVIVNIFDVCICVGNSRIYFAAINEQGTIGTLRKQAVLHRQILNKAEIDNTNNDHCNDIVRFRFC
jgi:hypothetical protein